MAYDYGYLNKVGYLIYDDISKIDINSLISFVMNESPSSTYFEEPELRKYKEILEETFKNLNKMGITEAIWNLAYKDKVSLSVYKNGIATIGMSKDQVYFTMGRPKKINTTETKYTCREQLVYHSSYVYLENGVVTSVQH